mmetsp:Transcript_54652/g.163311  ORF Transcript_54652/g.163311 Transcript_54652/m.163311 type:complete len:235 (-) Transcript_54652:20-724(-)
MTLTTRNSRSPTTARRCRPLPLLPLKGPLSLFSFFLFFLLFLVIFLRTFVPRGTLIFSPSTVASGSSYTVSSLTHFPSLRPLIISAFCFLVMSSETLFPFSRKHTNSSSSVPVTAPSSRMRDPASATIVHGPAFLRDRRTRCCVLGVTPEADKVRGALAAAVATTCCACSLALPRRVAASTAGTASKNATMRAPRWMERGNFIVVCCERSVVGIGNLATPTRCWRGFRSNCALV